VFSKSALFKSARLASLTEKVLIGRLLPKLHQHAVSRQPVDFLVLSYGLCLDYVNGFIFGCPSGLYFLFDENTTRHWLEQYDLRYCKEAFWPQELPTLTSGLKAVGIDMLPKAHAQSKIYLENWMLELCGKADDALSLASEDPSIDPAEIPTVYEQVKKCVEADLKGADPRTKQMQIASELFDHMCR
jgi:hypothetical protein